MPPCLFTSEVDEERESRPGWSMPSMAGGINHEEDAIMRALVASSQSKEHIELREVPEPSPAPNESVIAVRSLSLNRGEVNRLAGAQDGAVFGWDVAGTVLGRAADGRGPQVGARVVAFVRSGAWAERVAVPHNRLALLPEEVTFAAASTLPVAGLTALRTLRLGGAILGRRVLVTGAAGGVGRFAVQLASQAGAHVTGVVGSAERGQGLRELGADEIVLGLEGVSGTFDLILESAGGASLARAFELIAPLGTIVTFGNSSRQETTFSVNSFYSKPARLQGFSLLAPSEPQNFGEDLAYLASRMAAGQLDPQIGLERSWQEAATALAALRDRQVPGKAVLRVE